MKISEVKQGLKKLINTTQHIAETETSSQCLMDLSEVCPTTSIVSLTAF
jgi:hypothetical protein